MGNTHDERPCENEGVAPEFNFDLPQDPGLKEIPVRYVVHQLNQLAPLYWNRPQVATCAVLIPQPIQVEVPPPGRRQLAMLTTNVTGYPLETRRGSYAGIIPDARRRISAPTPSIFQRTQSRVLLLHSEFLLPQSTLFRALFAPTSNLSLFMPSITPKFDPPWTPFRWPARRTPRLITSRFGLPSAQIPLPHPPSFPTLLHWLYFGDRSKLSAYVLDGPARPKIHIGRSVLPLPTPLPSAHSPGSVEERWRGLVLNAEYLGLDVELRAWLSEFWVKELGGSVPEFVEERDDSRGERARSRRSDRRGQLSPARGLSVSDTMEGELARRFSIM
ncbi:uncharacterized protein EI90DRAFT_937106 [Cantharellus anzutake]|uniref:uncharacterized protein n=1 Tax=Cantharellus anzutake TaxID=1750568 RepID=UPI00190834A0|nr:uncharacterized protein EI90DRAFT_937106 [Cantharellus anzutake]KAF8311676.1 hypothetical protein EI90DRAFT_937106 [Cantharellus anzutake]